MKLLAASGTTPSDVKGNRNRASLDITTNSANPNIVAPMPTANPLTAQIKGLGNAASTSMNPGNPCRPATKLPEIRPAISTRSAPDENARPVPVTITTAVVRFAPNSMRASVAASYKASLNEFSASGRFYVIVATRPTCSMTTRLAAVSLIPTLKHSSNRHPLIEL